MPQTTLYVNADEYSHIDRKARANAGEDEEPNWGAEVRKLIQADMQEEVPAES